jgi:hypothetical protein
MKKERPIHIPHPNGHPHPFKCATLCGKLVRFGGIRILKSDDGLLNERPATCKTCLQIDEKICPTRRGTGTKP